jgi:hypothetical protein
LFILRKDGLMASVNQIQGKLEFIMAQRVVATGTEPPRLVRANSAFAKAGEK